MNLLKIFWQSASLFSLIFVQGALASPSCESLIKKISFARLEHAAATSALTGHVETPYWFQRALPEGVKFVATAGREHAPHRIQKELGQDFVAVQVDFNYNGNDYTTTVGLSPDALADNLFRAERGEPLTFLPENARAGGLWVHGGGTESSTYANAANSAGQFSKRLIYVVGMDWWGHGSNRPKNYSTRPLDYIEAAPWFMNKYLGHKVPLFQTGHSMGGQIADLIQTHLSPADIDKKFPGLPLKGLIMLSPPTDPTAGGSLLTKITQDREYTDSSAQEALFDKDNMNLVSQEPLTDQFFMQRWNDSILNRDMLPAFSGMGVLDDVCYLGCQDVYAKFLEARKNVKSVLYSNVVDHNGTPIKPDHMIPKYYEPGQEKKYGLGATIPIAFAHALEFLEHEVLGNKDFKIFNDRDLKEIEKKIKDARNSKDPKKLAELEKIPPIDPIKESVNLHTGTQITEAEQVKLLLKTKGIEEENATPEQLAEAQQSVQTANAQKAYRGGLSKIIGLYAKNTLFREFVKNFQFKKRVSASSELAQDLNTFLAGIERLLGEAAKYDKFLSNPRVPVETPEHWKSFFDWMRWRNPKDKAAAELAAKEWSTSENAGLKQAAALLGETFGGTWNGPKIKDLPPEFKISVNSLLQAASHNSKSWALFHKWFETRDPALREQAETLARKWASPEAASDGKGGENYEKFVAARALAQTLGAGFEDLANAPLPKKFPKSHPLFLGGNNPSADEIANWFKHKGGISEILLKLEHQRQIVLGYRDLNLEALTYAYPELHHLRDEQNHIFLEHRELVNLRNIELLPALVTLHAQRLQMQRLFTKDALTELVKKGAELDVAAEKLPMELLQRSNLSALDIKELYLELEQAGWKTQAFESFIGPDLRNFFSTLNDLVKNHDAAKSLDKQARVEAELVTTWYDGIELFINFANQIRGAKSFSNIQNEKLQSRRDYAESVRNDALDILSEFFTLRENFIRENHHLWTDNSRPQYPERYYELISLYKSKQSEYQHARQSYDIEQRELAVSGAFGPYLQFIFGKLDDLENQILILNGNERDVGHRKSLTSVEARIQEIEERLAEIDEQVISQYLPTLYRSETVRAWEVLNNPNEKPPMDMINQLLDAWNRIWRDPTGGQVQDSTAY